MKKILIFSLAYYPKYVGGAEVAIKEITDRIHESEMQFDMITLRFDSSLPKEERVGNVSVYRIGFTKQDAVIGDLMKFPIVLNKYLFPFMGAWKAFMLHREEKYDAIWAMMANYAGFAALFFKLAHPNVKYLLTLQEGDPIEYILKRVGVLRPLFVRIFTKADFIQPISNFLANWARTTGYTGPLAIVPNAVDTKHFAQEYPPHEIALIREKLEKKEGDVFVITTSRLVTKNAVDIVIRSLAYLPKHVHFIVLGIGPDEAMLKQLVVKEGVSDRVKFVGQVGHADMPKYLKASDIFIRPSRSEGMGNSFVEAMACRIPVVATAVGGIPDFLFDPVANPDREPTGLFALVADPKDTTRAIMQFIEDDALRVRCVENAYRMVIERYDWNIIAGDMHTKVFDKLWAK